MEMVTAAAYTHQSQSLPHRQYLITPTYTATRVPNTHTRRPRRIGQAHSPMEAAGRQPTLAVVTNHHHHPTVSLASVPDGYYVIICGAGGQVMTPRLRPLNTVNLNALLQVLRTTDSSFQTRFPMNDLQVFQ